MSDRSRVENVTQYVFDLEDLVRWLALPYGDNDPLWSFKNLYGPLPDNVRLAATWHWVVRGGAVPNISTKVSQPEVPMSEEGAQ